MQFLGSSATWRSPSGTIGLSVELPESVLLPSPPPTSSPTYSTAGHGVDVFTKAVGFHNTHRLTDRDSSSGGLTDRDSSSGGLTDRDPTPQGPCHSWNVAGAAGPVQYLGSPGIPATLRKPLVRCVFRAVLHLGVPWIPATLRKPLVTKEESAGRQRKKRCSAFELQHHSRWGRQGRYLQKHFRALLDRHWNLCYLAVAFENHW